MTLLLLNLLIITYIVFYKVNKKKLILMLMLIVNAMFIVNVTKGVDYQEYSKYFLYYSENLIWTSNYFGVEYSFGLLCYIFDKLGLTIKSLLICYYSISMILIYKSIKLLDMKKKESFIFILTMIALCFNPFLTITRQFLSVSLVFYAMVLYKKGFFKKSIIMYILSISVHNSSIFCLPLYFFIGINKNVKKDLKILIPIICIIVSKSNIIPFLFKEIGFFSTSSYVNYILNPSNKNFENTGIVFLSMFLVYIVPIIILKNVRKKEEKESFFEMGQMIYFSLMFLTEGLGFTQRITYYFSLFECYIFNSLFKKISKSKIKNIVEILACLCLYLFSTYIIIKGEFL